MTATGTGFTRKQIILGAGSALAALLLLAYLGAQEYAPASSTAKSAAEAPVFDPAKLTPSAEITLGLKATPALVDKYKGLSAVAEQKELVARVGAAIAASPTASASGWKFQFQLLAEPDLLNAFALPGGQVFVTTGLLNRLRTEGEVAAVLAQQVAHVIQRHAVKKAAADMAEDGSASLAGADMDGFVATRMADLRFAAAQETEADKLAVTLMGETGYSPNALLGLMQVLGTAYYAGAAVEYFTTHPNTNSRVADIQAAITALYPDGVPPEMSK